MSRQSTVHSRQSWPRAQRLCALICPARARAKSSSRSSDPLGSRPRSTAVRSQCSASYREARAMKRNRRSSGPLQRPHPSAILAPIESAARTSCIPSDHLSNDDQPLTAARSSLLARVASLYVVSSRKLLPTTGEVAAREPSPPGLSTVDCRLSTRTNA